MLYSLLELIPKDAEVYQSPFIRCYMQFCNRREVLWVVTPELLVFCHSIGIRTVEPGTPNRVMIFFTNSNSPVPTPMHSQVLFHIRYKCHHWQSGGLIANLFSSGLDCIQIRCVLTSHSKNCLLMWTVNVWACDFIHFLILLSFSTPFSSHWWERKWLLNWKMI